MILFIKKRYKAIVLVILTILLVFSGCDTEKSHINKGHRWFNRGNFDSAIMNYSWALDDNPYNPDIYFYRGLAFLNKGESDYALADFSKVIELESTYVMAYINRGTIWKEKGDLDKALFDYNMVLNLSPADNEAYMARADVLFKKSFFNRAISDYNIAIENKHDLTNAYMGRGDSYYYKKEYGNAIRDYEKSVEIDPANKFAYNNLAWLLSTCIDEKYRNGQRAIRYAEKAVSLNYTQDNLHTLAAAYAENKMYTKAIKIMETIFEKNVSVPINFEEHLSIFKQNKPLRELPSLQD